MDNLQEILLNEYENQLFESRILESYKDIFSLHEIKDIVDFIDVYEYIIENDFVNEEDSLFLLIDNILEYQVANPKLVAIKDKKRQIRSNIKSIEDQRKTIEDRVKKSELNKDVISNKKDISVLNVASAKIQDKDTSKPEEKVKKLKMAEKKAGEIVDVKKEITKHEENPKTLENDAKISVLKTFATKKSLELKNITSTEKTKPEIEKKIADIDQKLQAKIEKAKEVISKEEPKTEEPKSEEPKATEEPKKEEPKKEEPKKEEPKKEEPKKVEPKKVEPKKVEPKTEEIEKLELEIENLQKLIEDTKDSEDDLLKLQKEKTDMLANGISASGLKTWILKKRTENRIQFTEELLKFVSNNEQKRTLTKSNKDLIQADSKVAKKIEIAEKKMEVKVKKGGKPEEIKQLGKAKSQIIKQEKTEKEESKKEEKKKKDPSTEFETSKVVPSTKEDEAKESRFEIFKLRELVTESAQLTKLYLMEEELNQIESNKNYDSLWSINIAISKLKNSL